MKLVWVLQVCGMIYVCLFLGEVQNNIGSSNENNYSIILFQVATLAALVSCKNIADEIRPQWLLNLPQTTEPKSNEGGTRLPPNIYE